MTADTGFSAVVVMLACVAYMSAGIIVCDGGIIFPGQRLKWSDDFECRWDSSGHTLKVRGPKRTTTCVIK